MSRIAVLAVSAALLASAPAARAALEPPAPPRALTPHAAVQPELLDFGDVALGVSVESDFEILNLGDPGTQIEVIEIRLDFGLGFFALVDPPATPFSLLAGQAQAVTVRFTPVELEEHFGRVSVWVEGDPLQTRLEVALRGRGSEGPAPPVADAGGPYQGIAGVPLEFDGSGSFDPNGDPVTYSWEFGDGGTSALPAPVHVYTLAASYTVVLTVDDGALAATDTTTAAIEENLPPLADAGGPYAGHTNVPLLFDGSGSHDPNGQALTYRWDFGDGATGDGAVPEHSYANAGTFTVTLAVSDGQLEDGDQTTAAIALDRPPVADAGGPYAGTVCDGIPFDGSGSFDPDGDPLLYAWDYGDGASGLGPFAGHLYLTPGDYQVVLAVSDPFFTARDTTAASILPPAPPRPVQAALEGGPAPGLSLPPPLPPRDGDCVTNQGAVPNARLGIQGGWETQGACLPGCPGDPGELIGLALTLPSCGDGVVKQTRIGFATADAGDLYHLYLWRDGGGIPNDACGLECAVALDETVELDGPSLEIHDWSAAGCPCATFGGEPLYVGVVYVDDGTPPDWRLAREQRPGEVGRGFANLSGEHGDWVDTESFGLGSRWAVEQVIGPDCAPLPPAPPVADAGGPYAGLQGTVIAFDGSGSWDPNGDPLDFAWQFGDGATAGERMPEHLYLAPGTFTVTLTVSDGVFATDDVTTAAIDPNLPPVADAGGPYAGTVCEPLTLDGTGSFDPEGAPLVAYSWEFGDGLTGAGPVVEHVYQGIGTFQVVLAVSDSFSVASDTTFAEMAPPGGGPLPPAGLPASPIVHVTPAALDFGSVNVGALRDLELTVRNVGEPGSELVVSGMTLSGDPAFSLVDPPATPFSLPVCAAQSLTVRFTPVAPDSATGTLELLTSDPGAPVVTVPLAGRGLGPEPPVADAGGPDLGAIEVPLAFDGTGSFDPNGDPLSYLWAFGDGATAGGAAPLHTYAAAGLYTVTLTVSDGALEDSDVTSAEILAQLPPVADAGGPYAGVRGEFLCFDGSGSFDPDGDPITYAWSFGDGGSGSGATPGHIYVALGVFTVVLEVSDGQATGADTTTATIAAEPAPGAPLGWAALAAAPGALVPPAPPPGPVSLDDCISSQGADPDGALGLAGCWPPQVECVPGAPGEPGNLIGFALPLESCRDGFVRETRVLFDTVQPSEQWRVALWRDQGGLPVDACGLECGRDWVVGFGGPGPRWETFDWIFDGCPCVTFEGERLQVGVLYVASGTPPVWTIARQSSPGQAGMGYVNPSGRHGDWVDVAELGEGSRWAVQNLISDSCGGVPVELFGLAAVRRIDGGVELEWRAGEALEVTGFHVERAARAAGPYARLTAARLPLRPDRRYRFRDAAAPAAVLWYRVVAVERSGLRTVHGPVEAAAAAIDLPEVLALHQNHPNPLNPETVIRYDLPVASPVSLRILDARGRLVRRLRDGPAAAGRHAERWDGRDEGGRRVGSGVYFYELETPARRLTRKLVVLR